MKSEEQKAKALAGGKRLGGCAFYAMLLLGIFVAVGAGIQALRVMVGKWETAEGVVTVSAIEHRMETNSSRRGSSYDTYYLRFRYAFSVAGTQYEGQTVKYGADIDLHGNTSPSPVNAVVSRYPQGSAVTVHYKRSNPKICILDPDYDSGLTMQIVMGLLLIGFAFLIRFLLSRVTSVA